MKIPWFFKRYLLFALAMLIGLPLVFSLFMSSPSYHFDLRAVYLLQKLHITVVVLTLVLFIVSFAKIKNLQKPMFDFKKQSLFMILAVICFSLAISTQIDIDKILSQGVTVKDEKVNFDGSRWLSISVLSDIDLNKGRNLLLSSSGDSISKIAFLDEVSLNPEVKWFGKWVEFGGDGWSSDCKVALLVNENEYDVSEKYSSLQSGEWAWISTDVSREHLLVGTNKLVLKSNCTEAIIVQSQDVYVNHQTKYFYNNKSESVTFNEAIFFVKQDSGFFYSLNFKLGFIFRILGVLFLFISVFGLDFFKFLLKNTRLELFFSFIFSTMMYWFADFIRAYWYYLSYIVTYANYFLLKISMLNPEINMTNPSNPMVGPSGFVLSIADSCSGIDSISYFIIAYIVLIVVNWRQINHKAAFLLLIPGLIGTMIVNIFRIYLLFLIGVFFSKDFALNAYHTNAGMILFVIYFLSFWFGVQKYLMKKDDTNVDNGVKSSASKKKSSKRKSRKN